MDVKRLYKSKNNKMLFGLLGGLAEYYKIDATFIRIIFIFILISHTGGILLVSYVLASAIIPDNPN